MSTTSLLYHGFKVRGYRYLKTEFIEGAVIFHIAYHHAKLACAACGSADVARRGAVVRRLRSLPIGAKPVWLHLAVPRLQCHACQLTRQARASL